MILILQLIIVAVLSIIGTYLAGKLKRNEKLRLIIPTVAALLGFTVAFATDEIAKVFSKPHISVSTKRTQETIAFDIEADKHSLKSIVLNYHLAGHITNIQCMNPRSDVFFAAWVEGEPNMPYITNRLEVLLSDITPHKKLHFIVYYLPLQTKAKITFLGSDRYELNYKWDYKGEIFSDVQWRMVENDQLTKPPPGMISVIRYSKDPNATFPPIIRKRELRN